MCKAEESQKKLFEVLKKKSTLITNLRDEVSSWKAVSAADTGLNLACCNRTTDRGSPYAACFEDHVRSLMSIGMSEDQFLAPCPSAAF